MASSGEERIHAIIRHQQDAWNRGDPTAFASHFDESGTFTSILGEVYYGQGPFEERHARILSTIFKGSSVCMTIRRLHFPTSDIAVVDVDTEIAGYQALPPGVRLTTDGVLQTRLLEVLVRRHNEWSVVAYHNVDLKPPAQPAHMPRDINHQIRRDEPLEAKEIEDLRAAVGWERFENKYDQILKNSYAHFTVHEAGRLLAFVNVISDGIGDAFLVDLIIHPRGRIQQDVCQSSD